MKTYIRRFKKFFKILRSQKGFWWCFWHIPIGGYIVIKHGLGHGPLGHGSLGG